jgi:hypothetical protein
LPDGLDYQDQAILATNLKIDCDNLNPLTPVVVDTANEPIGNEPEEPGDQGDDIEWDDVTSLDDLPTDPVDPKPPEPDPWRPPDEEIVFDTDCTIFCGKRKREECLCEFDEEEMSLETINDVGAITPGGGGTPMETDEKKCSCNETKETIKNGKICRTATDEEKKAVRRASCQERYQKCLEKANNGYTYSWCSRRRRKRKYYPRRRYYGGYRRGYGGYGRSTYKRALSTMGRNAQWVD